MSRIVTFITFLIIVFVIYIYNNLIKSRNKVKEEYLSMNVCLKKRWDLIPDLVEAVKGYSAFEENVLEKLAILRNQEFNKFTLEQKNEIDNNISKVVSKMIVIAENNPDLKENEEFKKLREEFVKLEDDISKSRLKYNEAVKEYNVKLEVIPNNIVAILFGFNEEKMI